MPSVVFYKADVAFLLKHRSRLQRFIPSVFQNEGKQLQCIHFVFCSDEYLLKMNQQFLKHDYYTDILTFDLSEGNEIVAEVYISIDRVKENSDVINAPFINELLRIVFHGVLHLCGYKDKKRKDKQIMTTKEDQLLQSFSSFHVKQKRGNNVR